MIIVRNINICYDHEVLHTCDISLYDATFTLIKGESGAGKSSLLYHIGLISSNQDFDYQVMNRSITNEQDREQLRKIHFGYVLQDSALFDHYDVLGNLALYTAISGLHYSIEEYQKILSMVHLDCDLHQSITTLSGGERQRLAIACVLCKQADVMILDEVTSSLDEENERCVLEVLKELAKEQHRSIVMASHSELAISYADVIYEIQNQSLVCTRDHPHKAEAWKHRTVSLSFQFYKQYIQYFFRKYAQLNRSIIAIMGIAIYTLFTAFGLFQFYTKQSLQEFTNLYQNQAFITNAYNQDYVDDVLLPMSNDQVALLDELHIQGKRYPFISAQLMVNGTPVWVLPSFDSSFYDEKLATTYQHEGILLSKDAFDLFQSTEDTITTQIVVNECVNQSTIRHEIQDTFAIRGVLKQTVKSPYMKGTCFIYMGYEELVALYQRKASSTTFVGYSIVANDYRAIQQLEKDLYDVPMGLNTTFCDAKTMDSLNQSVAWIKGISITMVTGIFFVMLFAFQMKYLYSRSKEFALLKINGMSNQHVGYLLLLEALFKYGVALLSSIILMGGCNFILFILGVGTLWPSIEEVAFIVFFSLFVCVGFGWCVSIVKVKKVNPEQILRT